LPFTELANSLDESLSDQLTRWCCIDRLSSHAKSDKSSSRTSNGGVEMWRVNNGR